MNLELQQEESFSFYNSIFSDSKIKETDFLEGIKNAIFTPIVNIEEESEGKENLSIYFKKMEDFPQKEKAETFQRSSFSSSSLNSNSFHNELNSSQNSNLDNKPIKSEKIEENKEEKKKIKEGDKKETNNNIGLENIVKNKDQSVDKNILFRIIHNSQNETDNDKSDKEENKNQKNKSILIGKKRGRKTAKAKEEILKTDSKIHDKMSFDNLLRKTQVHYISFLIEFFNEIISLFEQKRSKELKLLNLNYEIIKNVNKEFVNELKEKMISELICSEISPKFRSHPKNHNKLIFQKISKKYPLLQILSEKKFLDYFERIYYKSERKVDLSKFGIKTVIDLSNSKNIHMYRDNVKKYNTECPDYEKKLEDCLRKNGYLKPIPKLFVCEVKK